MLIDTHCHLDEKYTQEADELLSRAKSAGVGAFVCVGVGGLESARQALALAGRRADVAATVGIHPHDAHASDPALEQELAELAQSADVVAVGEIGLDFHYDHSPRAVQGEVFRRFIALARELGKPIVVHTRSAARATLDILREEQARDVGGVIHCFSEDLGFAREALELNFDLSFSGIVTFKNAKQIREVAAWAPDRNILLETDSPYLAPVPKRGRPCEPAYVVHTAACVAALRNTAPEALAELTTQNACRRFGTRLARAVASVQNTS
ncbi:MAG TPA: TatD family hydrolase [Polyangiaceae bacterium]|nr:TatD family hydrolase [Polyangiaceae bacterium]